MQLKQHQLNSKFPLDNIQEKQRTHDFMLTASAVGFGWAMETIAWLCSPTQAKKRLVFAFLDFMFLFCFVLFCFLWPSMFQPIWLAEQALCSTDWMLLVHYAHLWTTGHFSIHLVKTEDEDHLLDKSRWSSPKRFTVLGENGVGGQEKEEYHGEGPTGLDSSQLPKSRTLWWKKSRVVLSTLIRRAAHCVWTLSWRGSWLLCSIDFLCHRQYYCSWKVHYFFKLPYSEKGIFLKDSVIYLWKTENQ